MSSPVHRLPFWTRLLVGLGSVFFKLWALCVRIKLSDRLVDFIKANPQALILLWHNRLGLALMLVNRKAPHATLTGLVSASRDGAILAELMQNFGIQGARGSSSRRAMSATKELLSARDAGRSLVVTPDGPRGPIYQAKPGIESIAKTTPTYVLCADAPKAWHANSWDRFILPKPFSTISFDIIPIAHSPSFQQISQALAQSCPEANSQ